MLSFNIMHWTRVQREPIYRKSIGAEAADDMNDITRRDVVSLSAGAAIAELDPERETAALAD